MPIELKPIVSPEIWERFVLATKPTALFQSWLWGEAEKSQGQTVWRFGVYQGGSLVGVFQVLKVQAKRGTFLHIRHGPILDANYRQQYRRIVDFLIDLARREKAWFIRMSPQIEDSPDNRTLLHSFGMLPAAIHAMDAEVCWVLDVTKTEAELLAGMRKTTRYEIRRAQKLGVTVRLSTRIEDLRDFHKLYSLTSSRQGFVPHRGIDEEFRTFAQAKCALLLTGEYNGEVLASAIILFYGPQAIYHHAASIPSHIPVTYALQWRAICEAKKRGKLVYNFWGIAPEDNPKHPWQGITLFKKGFGGREIRTIHAYDLPISPLYGVSRAIEAMRRASKHY